MAAGQHTADAAGEVAAAAGTAGAAAPGEPILIDDADGVIDIMDDF